MSFVNYHTKEINCKIVYYGPGLGGKTTNIQYIFQKTSSQNKGQMITLNTENERTLFFDFLPLDLGEIRGFKTRFHLYTVPDVFGYRLSAKCCCGIYFFVQNLDVLDICFINSCFYSPRVDSFYEFKSRRSYSFVSEMDSRLNLRNYCPFLVKMWVYSPRFKTLVNGYEYYFICYLIQMISYPVSFDFFNQNNGHKPC